MNKKTVFISLAGLLGIIFIMFFSLKIFQIVYFNEKYYKVPNLKSYTVKEVTEALKNSELSIKEAGEEFSDLVFTTGMGSPCSRYIVDKEVKKVIKRIREKEAVLAVQEQREPKVIRDFHPHTLRHTFATRCFENKMEPKVVQSLLGHSSISITLNTYTHVLDNKMDEEIKKFGVAKTQNDPYSEIDVGKVRITAKSHY